MRIELEKQNTADECFDELAYIAFNFKKFLKDPELKVQPMGPLMKKYTWYALLETVVMLALWMLFGQGIFFYLAELFFIILLSLQLYKIKVNS
ncbi:MAG: hypothetical protein IKX97_06205, partial [Erysipelotrichaceae bacterium]|nr:hypothetical protein [Erysipelotrichaceae bacterium]